jgi:uncharacterized protein Usg
LEALVFLLLLLVPNKNLSSSLPKAWALRELRRNYNWPTMHGFIQVLLQNIQYYDMAASYRIRLHYLELNSYEIEGSEHSKMKCYLPT